MKKILLFIFSAILSLFHLNVFAQNYDYCDEVYNFKFLDNNKDYSFVCNKNEENFVVLNDKIISKLYKNRISEYSISDNLKDLLIISQYKDPNNGPDPYYKSKDSNFVYLNDKEYGEYKYAKNIIYSKKYKVFYYIITDKEGKSYVYENGKNVTPNGFSYWLDLYISKSGDLYFLGCNDGNCNIYKNLDLYAFNSSHLAVSGDNIAYISYTGIYKNVVINNNVVYSTKDDLYNLNINEKGDFFVIQYNGLKTNGTVLSKLFVVKNGKIVSKIFSSMSEFVVSNDFNSYYLIYYKDENRKIYLSNGKEFNLTHWSRISYFDNDKFYYVGYINNYNYHCYFDKDGDIFESGYCGKGWYDIYFSTDGKIKIVNGYSDYIEHKYKINDTEYILPEKYKFEFLSFSNDSKKMSFILYNSGKGRVYVKNIK